MMNIDINAQRAAFVRYLAMRYKDNALRQQSVLHMVEDVLPGYAQQHLNGQFTTLYAITEQETLRQMDSAIYANPILRQEEKAFGELCLRNILRIYKQFLNSSHNPLNGDYMPPAPVAPELTDKDVAPKPAEEKPLLEGAEVQDMHSAGYERNPEARRQCIDYFKSLHGGHIVCECCGFDFSRAYRDIGDDYIEVHHRTPVSQRGGEYEVNPQKDLVPLCSNCHSMIHRIGGQGDCMTLEELKTKYFIGKTWN